MKCQVDCVTSLKGSSGPGRELDISEMVVSFECLDVCDVI
jgi:hypothetical protein